MNNTIHLDQQWIKEASHELATIDPISGFPHTDNELLYTLTTSLKHKLVGVGKLTIENNRPTLKGWTKAKDYDLGKKPNWTHKYSTHDVHAIVEDMLERCPKCGRKHLFRKLLKSAR